MSRSVWVRISAKLEIAEADDWYEERKLGLGAEFRAEVHEAIERIAEDPFLYPELLYGNRRLVLRRFPYNIWFRVVEAEVVIMAVVHGKRSRRHVRGRLVASDPSP